MNCISRNIYMYILKRKLSLTHSHTNKQIKQQPQRVIYGASYKQ